MDTQNKRLIDVSTTELEQLIEKSVHRVLDSRLPKPDPKYFSVSELSHILGCSRLTLYKLKDQGKLPYRRLAGTRKIRFIQEDIDNFLLSNPGFKGNNDFLIQ